MTAIPSAMSETGQRTSQLKGTYWATSSIPPTASSRMPSAIGQSGRTPSWAVGRLVERLDTLLVTGSTHARCCGQDSGQEDVDDDHGQRRRQQRDDDPGDAHPGDVRSKVGRDAATDAGDDAIVLRAPGDVAVSKEVAQVAWLQPRADSTAVPAAELAEAAVVEAAVPEAAVARGCCGGGGACWYDGCCDAGVRRFAPGRGLLLRGVGCCRGVGTGRGNGHGSAGTSVDIHSTIVIRAAPEPCGIQRWDTRPTAQVLWAQRHCLDGSRVGQSRHGRAAHPPGGRIEPHLPSRTQEGDHAHGRTGSR